MLADVAEAKLAAVKETCEHGFALALGAAGGIAPGGQRHQGCGITAAKRGGGRVNVA